MFNKIKKLSLQNNLSYPKNNRPLKNKLILVTRPEDQAKEFMELLKERGADPLLFPTIRIIPPRDWVEVDEALSSLKQYDTLIFTSVNGVKYFFQRLGDKGMDCESLRNMRICAIGPGTAGQIERFRLRVDIVPDEYRAEAIATLLEKKGIAGRRFLLPRAEKARSFLPEKIKKSGGYITVLPVYRTAKGGGDVQAIEKLFQKQAIQVITFTSSSTVENFVELFSGNDISKMIKGCVVACIGPITADTAASLGIKTDIMPEKYTIQGLAEAISSYFTSP